MPVTLVVRKNLRQMPLKMAWGLTIQKSQGMTLQDATVDIVDRERQGLTFISISRVILIDGLHISPPFSYQRYDKR